jgi:SecD/SecF fusion protein
MLGKGYIRMFTIIFALIFLGQFILTFPTNRVESAADSYAQSMAQKSTETDKEGIARTFRAQYLDSMSTESVFSIPLVKQYTYQDLKKQQLALGLDLKGGMSVLLQVDLRDFLKSLSNNSADPAFNTALEAASNDMKTGATDYIAAFSTQYAKVANGAKLASIFGRNDALKDKINFESSDADVMRLIRDKANGTVELTYQRLKDRIDELGVTQPNISLDKNRDIIMVELPGIDNPKRARSFLEAAAKLEFWDVYRIGEIAKGLTDADKMLKNMLSGDTSAIKNDTSRVAGPLFSILQPNVQGAGATIGTADKNKMKLITEYLDRPQIKALFPRDLLFRWAQKPNKNQVGKDGTLFELYALRQKGGDGGAMLGGETVTQADANPDPQTGQVQVSLKMNNTGAKKWGEITTKAANDGNREVAIVLDNKVVSAPRVINPILTGDSQITGSYTLEEAKDLAKILQIGQLPARTTIIQESVVGPSLGQENINKSLSSLAIGLLAIIALMIFYYSTGGIFSVIALLVNLFFIIGTLTSLGAVLTLPGIAGIVLTMASAVDANVIIFERVREELAFGKTLSQAIKDGFYNSYPAIFDANISNLLIAVVMFYFGLGPIKGFATVLIVGILSTIFTAVFLAHLLLEWWVDDKGKPAAFSIPATANLFHNIKYDWVGKRKIAYIASSLVILAGIASFFTRGFELGVDFKGGYSYNVKFDKNINAEQLRNELTTVFGGTPIVKSVDISNTYNITTSYLVDDNSSEASEKVIEKLHQGIAKVAGEGLKLEDFKNQNFIGTHVTSFSKVGSSVADDIKNSAVKATFFALLLIFLYIFVRFNKWQFSAGAIIALFHDVLLVMAIFTLFHGLVPFSMEIDQAFIAAILTVIGYSMNDTVVVYDRIREFLNTYVGRSKAEVINDAINNTLSRTVMTSFITFLSMLILFALGGSSIRGFAFALLIGVIVGTYSSIFVATPIMMDLTDENLTSGAKEVGVVKEGEKVTA